MKSVIIIGDGNYGKLVQLMVKRSDQLKLIAVLDDSFQGEKLKNGIKYGSILLNLQHEAYYFVAIGDNKIRKKITAKLKKNFRKQISLIDPTAYVDPKANIKEGSIIMAKAIVQAYADIGENVIINTGSIIEHDVFVADFAHICPGSILTGGVTIFEGALMGAGSTVIPLKKVGAWCVVGAGSVVIKNIASKKSVAGSPAKEIGVR